jgi:hypothetical protein
MPLGDAVLVQTLALADHGDIIDFAVPLVFTPPQRRTSPPAATRTPTARSLSSTASVPATATQPRCSAISAHVWCGTATGTACGCSGKRCSKMPSNSGGACWHSIPCTSRRGGISTRPRRCSASSPRSRSAEAQHNRQQSTASACRSANTGESTDWRCCRAGEGRQARGERLRGPGAEVAGVA